MRTLIKHVLAAAEPKGAVTVKGWVRTRRDAKGFSFMELNDGSCLGSLQCVVDAGTPGYDQIAHFTTGASAVVEGNVVPSPAPGQKWELRAAKIELIGPADASYPLQKKGHTLEFLRSIAHLRPRSNLFGAAFRFRSRLAFAVHEFFQSRDFVYVQTPIITASDCEGAGEMFRVTTLKGNPDEKPEADFFGKPSLPHGQRATGSGDFRVRALKHLYLRADVPGGEFQYSAARGGVLDDRAGDGLLRFARGHGPGRGVRQGDGPLRAGTLRGGRGVLFKVRGERTGRAAAVRFGASVCARAVHGGGRDFEPVGPEV